MNVEHVSYAGIWKVPFRTRPYWYWAFLEMGLFDAQSSNAMFFTFSSNT